MNEEKTHGGEFKKPSCDGAPNHLICERSALII